MQPALLTALRRTWDTTWGGLGLQPADATLFVQVCARYLERHRAYHTLQHLQECLATCEEVRASCERPAEVQLALWFHDAIYDTKASDSEEQSAAWAQRALAAARAPSQVGERVRDLVLATRHAATPASVDAAVTVDVDLAILGADEHRFEEYERQVRFEYAWVPEPLFRSGRARLLREFLARPAIYATAALRQRLEERARANLRRSIEALEREG
jgi:predicted metal-dependent HD superfamily phosphohydrolase